MKVPKGEWLILDEAASTQEVAAEALRSGKSVPGIILARHQTSGKGRLGRRWFDQRGKSLTVSIVFTSYADHPSPWLVGMALAAAAAGAIHCRLRWPNDLIIEGKKVGGVLTEMLALAGGGLVPVVGLGVNVGPMEFPDELFEVATCISDHQSDPPSPDALLSSILARARSMPEPECWADIEPVWRLFDDTPGKHYLAASGQTLLALGIGPGGELIASSEGVSVTVMAAEALFSAKTPTKGPINGLKAVPFPR